MSRRGNGEGTIYRNEAQRRWEGQLDLGVDSNGRRLRRKVTGKTKSEVAEKLRDIRERENHVRRTHEIRCVADLLKQWIDVAAAGRLGEGSTLDGYRHHVRVISTALGPIRVDQLTPEDVDAYLLSLAKAGYARSTVSRHRSILSQAVRWGIRRRYMAWDVIAVAEMPAPSVFDSAAPRVAKRRAARALNSTELRRFIEVARTRRNGSALVLGATLGLRPGEFTALLWDDLDLAEGVVHVRRAWKGSGEKRVLGSPKTKGSSRSLRLPGSLIADLRTHRQQQVGDRLQATEWPANDPGLVYTTPNGRPIDPANLRRFVRSVAGEAAVGHITPYDLRHSATSVLSAAGVRNEHLADLLGHADTRMVERHYRHRPDDAVDVAAGPMESLLG